MTDKAYVVTSGTYSDYRIIAVCLTKKAAEAYINRERPISYWSRDMRIEEYDIQTDETKYNDIIYLYYIVFRPNGDVVQASKESYSERACLEFDEDYREDYPFVTTAFVSRPSEKYVHYVELLEPFDDVDRAIKKLPNYVRSTW